MAKTGGREEAEQIGGNRHKLQWNRATGYKQNDHGIQKSRMEEVKIFSF